MSQTNRENIEQEVPVCAVCGKPPTCFGAYEGGRQGYACDECCGHGNEDGWCVPIRALEQRYARLKGHAEAMGQVLSFIVEECDWQEGTGMGGGDDRIGPAGRTALASFRRDFPQEERAGVKS